MSIEDPFAKKSVKQEGTEKAVGCKVSGGGKTTTIKYWPLFKHSIFRQTAGGGWEDTGLRTNREGGISYGAWTEVLGVPAGTHVEIEDVDLPDDVEPQEKFEE